MISALDLEHIASHCQRSWRELDGARLFVTGGTGFFGKWLLESFAQASRTGQLRAEMVVLSRNPKNFCEQYPHLADLKSLQYCQGDIADFTFPRGSFDFVIHGATAASVTLNQEAPLTMFDTIVQGTRRTLEFSRDRQVRRFLNISSGAIYGKQPTSIPFVEEDFLGAPDLLQHASAYAEGKRTAEYLAAAFGRAHDIRVCTARCFAFLGPYLPLDEHFAAGNLIRDGLAGNTLVIQGDGTPLRSYLYAADLCIWLWTLLTQGKAGRAYNVGSNQPYSIQQLAERVRDVFAEHFQTNLKIEIRSNPIPGKAPDRYLPSTHRADSELQLREQIDLAESIRRTIAWHRSR